MTDKEMLYALKVAHRFAGMPKRECQENPTSPGGGIAIGLLAVLLIGLSCVFDTRGMDVTLIPRLGFLFIILAVAASAIALWKNSRSLDMSVLKKKLVLCFGTYLAVSWLSLFYALNATAGFTDCFKTLGAFVFLCLCCLVLPMISEWPSKLARIAVCTGGISGGVGFYQIATRLGTAGISSRHALTQIDGLMSNVNLYASFLLLVLPLCLCGAAILRGLWRLAAVAVATSLVLLIVILQTRAAYLGLATGGSVLLILILAKPGLFGISPKWRSIVAGSAVTAFAGVALFFIFGDSLNPLIQRGRSIFSGSADASIGARLTTWKIAIEMIRDYFPLGVGAGNFTVRLDEYFDNQVNFLGSGTNWLQPHNDFLWVLSEKGALGLAAFVGFFGMAFVYTLYIFRRNPTAEEAWLAAFSLMGLTSYLVVSFFDFPLERVSHIIYVALYLSVLTLINRRTGRKCSQNMNNRSFFSIKILAALFLIPLSLGLYYSHVALKQEFYIQITRGVYGLQKWAATVENARLAATTWKTLDPTATPVAFFEGMGLKNCGKKKEAVKALELAYSQNPNRIHTLVNLGILYAESQNFTKAIEYFSLAIKRYPQRSEGYENLAACYMDMGDFSKAVQLLESIPAEKQTSTSKSSLALAKAIMEKSSRRTE